MAWSLQEAIAYYRRQGAPGDQTALSELLREIQTECGGGIPRFALAETARELNTKEALLLALIRRKPSLRLADTHLLEVCAGPNCGKHAALAAAAEKLASGNVQVRFVPCMRMCGKGPNIRWDGKVHNRADEALLRQLAENGR